MPEMSSKSHGKHRRSRSTNSDDLVPQLTDANPVKYLRAATCHGAHIHHIHHHDQRRVRIAYTDDAVRTNAQANMLRLLQDASEQPRGGSRPRDNSALIAKRALAYRRILPRVHSVNTCDPAFNADEFLGVQWLKVDERRP